MENPVSRVAVQRDGIPVVALAAVLLLACGQLRAQPAPAPATTPAASPAAKPDEKKPAAEEADQPEYNNSVTFGFGQFFLRGDQNRFQYQKQLPAGAFGGIEEFHFERPFDQKGLLQLDGRGIFDNHDYSLKLDVKHPDKGFLRAGYEEFRTWYDNTGGFNSQSNRWVLPLNSGLHIDRGEAFLEMGLTVPDWPLLTLSYRYQFRNGQKDSTIWGDTVVRPGANGTRGIVPTFLGVDEKRHMIAGDAKHTLGRTELGLGLRYDILDQDNTRNIRRTPGAASDRYVTQRDTVHSDMFNVHASTETRFNDRWLFTTGYSYTRLDTDVGGSRIFGASYDPIYDPSFARRQQRDEGFFGLAGGTLVNQYVLNLNLLYNPTKNWSLLPSIRVEKQDQIGNVSFTETAVQGGPGFLTRLDALNNVRNRSFLDVSESLEARYAGVTNWAFYVRGEWLQGEGNLEETERDAGTINLRRNTDNERRVQKYVAGANWYPLRKLSLAGQYYYKIRANTFNHLEDTTRFAKGPAGTNISDFYPAFIRVQEFDTHDVNFRLTWRPFNSVTLVSRYDFQLSTIDSQGDTATNGVSLAKIQSSEMTSHIFSESISWTPLARLFTQVSVSYAIDKTATPANNISVANAGNPAGVLVLPARNNYWNLTALAGYALSDKSDVQAAYSFYRSNNYVDNSAVSQPYGAAGEQHGITVTYSHRLSKNLLWKLRYGYYDNRDQTSGNFDNYQAQLVYTSLQYLF